MRLRHKSFPWVDHEVDLWSLRKREKVIDLYVTHWRLALIAFVLSYVNSISTHSIATDTACALSSMIFDCED